MSKHTKAKKSQVSGKQASQLGMPPQAPKAGQNGHN